MAAMNVQSVGVQFGTQVVLEEASLELAPNETVGLIGANGAGKTTLFRLMAGELKPDLGTVTTSKGLRIGYLRQEPQVNLDRTLHDEVGSVFEDLLALEKRMHALSDEMANRHDDPELPKLMERYERINHQFIAAGGYNFETRMNEILGGLGFSPVDYGLPMSVLSGGQKCRAALAKLLLQDRPMLLLDEPTNHLDIDAVRWLEKFLAGHQGGAVIVSHDRYLLDRLVTRVIELERRRLFSYPGSYSNFAKAKHIRQLSEQRQYEKDMEFIAKEREFIRKHMAGQRTKEAQGRRTRLERRIASGEFVTELHSSSRKAKLKFADGANRARSAGQTVCRCDGLCMRFDDKQLFSGLSLQVNCGDRFGITGPNGTGKTTLLKIILGELEPTSGEVFVDPKFKIGYYDQEHVKLDPTHTVVEEILSIRPEMAEEQVRSLLAQYLFTGDDVFKKMGQLSGGEQSRVRLAKLIIEAPDVLVLDEPTNHLDIPSREIMEESLSQYNGTIITVSHDRYFLDQIVQHLMVIRADGHATYHGNYSFYIQQVEQQRQADAPTGTQKRKKRGRSSQKSDKPRRKSSIYDPYGVDELEEMIMEREEKLAELHVRFGEEDVYRDPDLLEELKEEEEAVAAELAEIEAAWTERLEDEA